MTLFNDLCVLAPARLVDAPISWRAVDDRLRASGDGRSFTAQRWSTPLRGYRTVGLRRVATHGEARWHAPEPEGVFSYLELDVDEITYNTGAVPTLTTPGPGGRARGGRPMRR